MKRYSYIVLMLVVLLLTGCKERANEPAMEVSFPISICLPAEEVYSARMNGPRHAIGDPGAAELFELPNYIYIFVMKQTGETTWELWRVITETGVADEGKWTKKRYVGLLQTSGDSIYQYNKEFNELLNPGESTFNGRVYVVASKESLTFDKTLNSTGITSLEDMENLAFNSGAVQSSIQHIYSTPYNYIVDGNYFGSFGSSQRVPHVSLMLYHVAAKVDITWSVADEVRIKADPAEAVRLTTMKACNLFNGDAYCFKPMENKLSAKLNPSAGKGDTISIVSAGDEGLWWEGRSYFYTIPYTLSSGDYQSHYPLQMQMETNGSGDMFTPTIYLQVSTGSSFVPWLRATFNLNSPLETGSPDKVVALTP